MNMTSAAQWFEPQYDKKGEKGESNLGQEMFDETEGGFDHLCIVYV